MYVYELSLQKESLQYHCLINDQKITDHSLGFKQIVNYVICADNFIRAGGLKYIQVEAFFDEI